RAHEQRVRGGNASAKLVVGWMLDIQIEQLERPVRRHERRERDETEGRKRRFGADHRHDMPVAPKGARGEFWIQQQSLHTAPSVLSLRADGDEPMPHASSSNARA